MSTDFGATLKTWRTARRRSQMDLGLSANVSPRHISFLETGRSRPSRAMVIQLCEELEVPRGARNQLLTAAGHAPAYAERGLDDEAMAPVREAIDWMLARHDPYPAFAIDRHWTLRSMNRTAGLLLAGLGLGPRGSLLEALADPASLGGAIENLDEVLAHMAARLRTEIAHLGGDPVLEAALARISPAGPPAGHGLMPAFVPTRLKTGAGVLSLFSTITQFGTAEDVALAELRIEMMFPADEPTRAFLIALEGEGG